MASGSQKRTRSERVAALELPPNRVARVLAYLRRGGVLLRIALGVLAAALVVLVTSAWAPPFEFRTGYVPPRDVVVRAEFRELDQQATRDARQRAASQVRYVYAQDPEPLVQLRAGLVRRLIELTSAETAEALDPKLWDEFQPPPTAEGAPATIEDRDADFLALRAALAGEEAQAQLAKTLADIFQPFERNGLLDRLPQELDTGNQEEIFVHPLGQPTERHLVKVTDVLIGNASLLEEKLGSRLPSAELARYAFAWLRPRITSTRTLALDEPLTREAREAAMDAVSDVYIVHPVGQVLAKGATAIGAEQFRLLELEHQALLSQRTLAQQLARGLSAMVLVVALGVLCGYYTYHRQRLLIANLGRYVTLLAVVVLTVALANWLAIDSWRAELIPMVLFGMTMTVAYRQELALLLSAAMALVLVATLGVGPPFGAFLVLFGTTAAAILMMARIRSRSKLIKVGFCASVVAFVFTLAAGVIEDQPLGRPWLTQAALNALWTFVTGFLMTGMLPFIESLFGVLTEISLLELGDVAHPLLQELVRRAPGTYNHSINVASLAEAAAESIGARGLLVRVGAYFHDIGKMLKPGYFVENMGQEANRHDALMPAMSTLIIIAHIKDGADLARQHHLPQPIIDFIEQHHGTTLVEYFFQRANQQRDAGAGGGEIDERSYRYPGPKPQTKEAAVLMMADAVESAARTLVDPTPGRVEGLVNEIAMKRLLDGQFDECGLNLRELHTVQESLIKSVVAVYHSRVKYPGQRTA